jgi:[acyl-carrier-protein] S-malonyltransferase
MSKVAFVFPGQASQIVGMGSDFYENSALARQYYDLRKAVRFFPEKTVFRRPADRVDPNRVTQPAIFVLSCIILAELKARGHKPDIVAGHSLGEYSALVAKKR